MTATQTKFSVEDSVPGDRLTFVYEGNGQNRGFNREVRVLRTNSNYITALDMTFGGTKSFNHNEISCCERFGKDLDRVEFENEIVGAGICSKTVAEMLTGEQIAYIYNKECNNHNDGLLHRPIEYDPNYDTFFVFMPVQHHNAVFSQFRSRHTGRGEVCVSCDNGNKTWFGIDACVGYEHVSFGGQTVTPQELAEKLTAFLLDNKE